MDKSELRIAAKEYVEQTLAQTNARASKANVKKAVEQLVRAFEPVACGSKKNGAKT